MIKIERWIPLNFCITENRLTKCNRTIVKTWLCSAYSTYAHYSYWCMEHETHLVCWSMKNHRVNMNVCTSFGYWKTPLSCQITSSSVKQIFVCSLWCDGHTSLRTKCFTHRWTMFAAGVQQQHCQFVLLLGWCVILMQWRHNKRVTSACSAVHQFYVCLSLY